MSQLPQLPGFEPHRAGAPEGSVWIAWPEFHLWTWCPPILVQSEPLSRADRVPVVGRIAHIARSRGMGILADHLHWLALAELQEIERCPVLLGFRTSDPIPLSPFQEYHSASPCPPVEYGTVALLWPPSPEMPSIVSIDTIPEGQALLAHVTHAIEQGDLALLMSSARQLEQEYWSFSTRQVQERAPSLSGVSPSGFPVSPRDIGFPIPMSHPVQSVIRAIQSNDWHTSEDGIPIFTTRTSDIAVSMRAPSNTTIDPVKVSSALWDIVRQQTDLDADIVLIQLAQVVSGRAYPDGSSWMTPDLIMSYRNIAPMTRVDADGKRVANGYRTEDRQAVVQAFERTAYIWLTIDVDRRRRTIRTESHLTQILERMVHTPTDIDQPEQVLGWRYVMGTWFTRVVPEPTQTFGWVLQRILQYDPFHERWEKRLGRYLLFHGNMIAATSEQTLIRSVHQVLEDIDLPIEQSRVKRWREYLEQALNNLVRDGIVLRWSYDRDDVPMKEWRSATLLISYPTLFPHRETLLDPPDGASDIAPPKRGRGRPRKNK